MFQPPCPLPLWIHQCSIKHAPGALPSGQHVAVVRRQSVVRHTLQLLPHLVFNFGDWNAISIALRAFYYCTIYILHNTCLRTNYAVLHQYLLLFSIPLKKTLNHSYWDYSNRPMTAKLYHWYYFQGFYYLLSLSSSSSCNRYVSRNCEKAPLLCINSSYVPASEMVPLSITTTRSTFGNQWTPWVTRMRVYLWKWNNEKQIRLIYRIHYF